MKIFSNIFILSLVVIGVFSACVSAPTPATETPSEQPWNPLPTLGPPTAAPMITRGPTLTPSPIPTRLPTLTPAFAFPESTPVFIGTAIADTTDPISAGNIERLVHTAEWGKGAIKAVAFTPDGSAFVVSSASGLAVYDMRDLASPPRWLPFEKPYSNYESLYFSKDGNYILLEELNGWPVSVIRQVRSFPGNQIVNYSDMEWLRSSTLAESRGSIQVVSPDGTRELRSRVEHQEDFWDIEYSFREIFDTKTGQLLFQLPDETFYLQYNDNHRPEGCDLSSFSWCGNVYSPNAFHPYRVAFSSSGETLAILYRVPNYSNSRSYSILRVYNAGDGELINIIGSLDLPVETFAYSPDGGTLLIGYANGSVQLWPVRGLSPTFGAQHFNAPIAYLQFSSDSKFLLIQRYGTRGPNVLEVRRTSDGALFASYDSTAFAVSPTDNLVAIADSDGSIRIRRVDTGDRLQYFAAHTNTVYSVAFSPRGQYVASSSEDCTVRLWDTTSGQFLHPFEETSVNAYGEPSTESRIFIYSLEFVSGTDQVMGFGSWGTAVSWNVNSGARNYVIESAPLEYYNGMITLNPHFPESFSVDLASDLFYIDYQGYDLRTGELRTKYQPPVNLPEGCASVGPVTTDGRLMFALGYNDLEGRICVLQTGDLKLIQTIDVIPDANYSYTLFWPYLSPDGRLLIVPTTDGVIHVYTVAP